MSGLITISQPLNVRMGTEGMTPKEAVQRLAVIQRQLLKIQRQDIKEQIVNWSSKQPLVMEAAIIHRDVSEKCDTKFQSLMNAQMHDIAKKSGEIEEKMPSILRQNLEILIAEIRKNIREEGLFRLCGSAATIEATDVNNKRLSLKTNDVHTLAGLLKKLLREMPNLLLEPVQELLIDPMNHNVDKVKSILAVLPKEHLELFHSLFSFLAEVAAEADHNKMKAMNLAICFTPNLVKQGASAEELKAVSRYNASVEWLINNYNLVR